MVQLDLVIVVPIARAVATARSAKRAGARTEPPDTATKLIVPHLPNVESTTTRRGCHVDTASWAAVVTGGVGNTDPMREGVCSSHPPIPNFSKTSREI